MTATHPSATLHDSNAPMTLIPEEKYLRNDGKTSAFRYHRSERLGRSVGDGGRRTPSTSRATAGTRWIHIIIIMLDFFVAMFAFIRHIRGATALSDDGFSLLSLFSARRPDNPTATAPRSNTAALAAAPRQPTTSSADIRFRGL